MRTNGQPSGHYRWQLSNQNRTKNIMNKRKVKHHLNSDIKTGNRDHIRTTAFERSVLNTWGQTKIAGINKLRDKQAMQEYRLRLHSKMSLTVSRRSSRLT